MGTWKFVLIEKEENLMDVKYIKNGIVNLLWDSQGFFESKTEGFIAAVHIYSGKKGEIPVMFKDEKAFVLLDPDTDMPTTRDDLYAVTAECFNDGTDVEDIYSDYYVEFGTYAGCDESVLSIYGLSSEDGKDIVKRLYDLKEYWEIVEEDAF